PRHSDPAAVPEHLELPLVMRGVAVPARRKPRLEPVQWHPLRLHLLTFHLFRYSPSHATGQASRFPSPGAPRAGRPAAAPRALNSPPTIRASELAETGQGIIP